MDVIKVIIIAFVGIIAFNLLKSVKNEYSSLIIICTGAIIVGLIIDVLVRVLGEFQTILDASGINQELFSGVLKTVGIGYVCEYAAGICRDSGSEGLANKILFAGKICIFGMSLPLIKGLIEMLMGMVR